MGASVATFTPGTIAAAKFDAGARGAARFVLSRAAAPYFDLSGATFSETGPVDMIAGGSFTETSGAGTIYAGLYGDQAEARVQLPVPAHTSSRLFVFRTAAPGVGCSITYTLRKNGVDTGVTVTLGAGDTSGASSSGTTVSFLAGDKLSVKEVRTGSCAAGIANFTVET